MPHPKRTREKLDAELAVHLRKGRADRAAATLAAIVEKDDDDDRPFVRLAELRLKLGDQAGARAAWQGAADAAERKGFYLRAMAALRQLARTLPPGARPWMELSRLALRLGLVGDALGFLDEGVRAWDSPEDRGPLLAALRRCHELAPDDVRRSLRLAHELRSAGYQADAVALLRGDAARHRAAGREEAWLSVARDLASMAPALALCRDVARTLLARGEPRGALKLLRPHLEGAGRDAEAVELAILARAELGRPVRPPLPETPPVLTPAPRPAARPAPARRDAPLATPRPAPLPLPPPVVEAPPLEELIDLAGSAVSIEDELPPEDDHELVDLADAVAEDEPPPIPPEEVADELAHAGFLVAHGFEDEARELLEALSAAHPGHPGVVELQVQLAAGRERRAPRPHPAAGPEVPATGRLDEVEFASAEAVLESFRQGVAASISSDDWATRHDLAIAYREMGLWSDALAEFETALLTAPGSRAVDCLVGVAQCHARRGHHAEAARALERALGVVPLPAEAAATVNYELGGVRLAQGDALAAARAYEAAERAAPGFRDALALAGRLRQGAAAPAASPGGPARGLTEG